MQCSRCLLALSLISRRRQSEPRTLIDNLVEEAKKDLKAAAKTRDAAAELLSRLLTRPDLQSQYLERFLAWATEVLTSSDDTFLVRLRYILIERPARLSCFGSRS